MPTLGQKIRELRDQKDISLREMAKRLDLSAAFLSDLELGRRYPSDEVLKNIAKILHVKFDELKDLDPRAPVEDLKRKAEADPQYAVALRALVDSNVSPEQILSLLKNQKNDKKK